MRRSPDSNLLRLPTHVRVRLPPNTGIGAVAAGIRDAGRQAGRQAGSVRRPCRNQGHLPEGCCRCALVEVIIRKAVLEQRNARKGHAIPCDLMNMILAHRRW